VPRVALPAFIYALLGTVAAGGLAFLMRRRQSATEAADPRALAPVGESVAAALWAGVAAWVAYLLYAVGWLPGATRLQMSGNAWAAGAIALVGGLLTVLWTARPHELAGD
jgi:hypothetical protein